MYESDAIDSLQYLMSSTRPGETSRTKLGSGDVPTSYLKNISWRFKIMRKEEIGLYLGVDDRVFKGIDRDDGAENCCHGCSLERNSSSCDLSGTGMYRSICTKLKLKWVEVQS
jgi:hypothetical protein